MSAIRLVMLKTQLKQVLAMTGLFAALLVCTVGTAQARLSEPEVIYYGAMLPDAKGKTVAIRLKGALSYLATFLIGADLNYRLRVPMDSVDPRSFGTARTGDSAEIVLSDGQVLKSVTIPPRGTLVSLNFELLRTAEQWEKDHPGDDGSGDMNRNGVSDLADYLEGKDPAGCVWAVVDSSHAETTVYSPKVLANCLKEAEDDLKHNLIRIARGYYAGNFVYSADWGEHFDLTLTGGYDPAGTVQQFGERTADTALTVLNGDIDNNQIGDGIVLAIDTHNNMSSGKIRIESLTFKNGKAPPGQNGGAIQAITSSGDLELVGNIFTANSATSGGAVSAESRDGGLIFLTNNLLYANSAVNAAAALLNSAGGGPAILLNNTIVENAANENGDGRSLLIKTPTGYNIDLTNNIISATANVSGKNIFINNTDSSNPLIMNNSIDASDLLVNTPGFIPDSNNIVCVPKFPAPASGNYRLGAASTCIDKGTAHAKLSATDADSAARVSGPAVDLGAYERSRFQLSLLFSGTGGGSVSGDIACLSGTTCSPLSFEKGAAATLIASPNIYSTFTRWSGACNNTTTDCAVIMNGDRSITATFALAPRAMIGTTGYKTIQEAYNAAATGSIIKLLEGTHTENIIFARPVSVMLEGGYLASFSDVSTETTIKGKVLLRSGKVRMNRVKVLK